MDFKQLIMDELRDNKQLLKAGDGGSSSGSDSAPSEDNLAPTELLKNLPIADKTLKSKIKAEKDKNDSKKAGKMVLAKQPTKRVQSPQKDPSPTKTERQKLAEKPKEPPTPAPPVEEKPKIDPKTGKPKPEMKDAVSQTDRSDYQIIKAKMLKER